MTTPDIHSSPHWPIYAVMAGGIGAVAVLAAVWLAGWGLDIDLPGGWVLVGMGVAGWAAATVTGCFGPLPGGRRRDVVLDAAVALSTVSLLLVVVGVLLAATI